MNRKLAALAATLTLGAGITLTPAEAAIDRAHIHNSGASWAGVTLYNEPCGQSYSNTTLLMPGKSTDNHGWDCVNFPGVEPARIDVYNGSNGGLIITRYYAAGTDHRVNLYNSNDYVITLT